MPASTPNLDNSTKHNDSSSSYADSLRAPVSGAENHTSRDVLLSATELIREIFFAIQEIFKKPLASQVHLLKPPLSSPDGRLSGPLTAEWATPQPTAAHSDTSSSSSTSNNNIHNGLTLPVVTVFAAADPDSVCAVYLLQNALAGRFGLQLRLIVVSCYAHLRQAFTVEASRKDSSILKSACYIFINVGARHDVRDLLDHTKKDTRIFILDSHRPLAASYGIVCTHSCSIVAAAEELQTVQDETNRLEKLLRRRLQREKREHVVHDGDVVDTNDDTDDDLDDEDDFDDEDAFAIGLSKPGEYNILPASLVVFEALRAENLDDPSAFFVTATGLASCLLIGTLSRADYCRHITELLEEFNRAKRRFGRDDRGFELIHGERREVMIPLLRFTSVQDAIGHSTAFLRAQAVRFGTSDVAHHELAHIRVQLGLQEAAWNEQFRLLTPKDQQRLLHRTIPAVFHQMTLISRRRLPRRYPDDEEMTGVITAPAFIRELRAVGLPQKVSSVDLGFLMLGLLTRPSPRDKINDYLNDNDTATTVTTSITSNALQNPFRPAHEVFGYEDPTYDTSFSEALCLLQSLGQRSLVFPTSQYDLSEKLGLGQIWDNYVPIHTNCRDYSAVTGSYVMKSLASLAYVVLRLQREVVSVVLRLLNRRRGGDSNAFRKAAWNIEGFLDGSLPNILYHPLWIRYIASIMSDSIARGIVSASPSIVLLATSNDGLQTDRHMGLALTFKPTTGIRDPSIMGQTLQEQLEHLKRTGMLDHASQDGFDASTAYVPGNKLYVVFTSLFPDASIKHDNLQQNNNENKKHSPRRSSRSSSSSSLSSRSSMSSDNNDNDITSNENGASASSSNQKKRRSRTEVENPQQALSESSSSVTSATLEKQGGSNRGRLRRPFHEEVSPKRRRVLKLRIDEEQQENKNKSSDEQHPLYVTVPTVPHLNSTTTTPPPPIDDNPNNDAAEINDENVISSPFHFPATLGVESSHPIKLKRRSNWSNLLRVDPQESLF